MLLKAHRYFVTKPAWFVLSFFAGLFLFIKLAAFLLIAFFAPSAEFHMPASEAPTDRMVLIALVVAPLLETLIYQYVPIRVLLSIKPLQKYPVVGIVVSTIAFSLAHTNPALIIFSGVVLAYNFYYFQKYKSVQFAYWSTVLLHAFYNLVTYLLAYKYAWVWMQ